MDVTTNRLLPGLEHRPTELGRIRLGDKSERGLPTKIETWRLTSGNRAALQVAADTYGGTVEEWTDGPSEGFYELLTESNTLQVLIPRDLRTLSQWYEWWQGGTCERRCDGVIEQNSQMPCLCKAEGTMECRPRTRLNIMLPDIPGLGVWRLETDGWNAATSLPATIEMLLSLSVQPWVKAVLRLEQRSAKKRQDDGKVVTHRFAVPVLDTPDDLTLGRIVGQRMRQETAQLEETHTVVRTAREIVAAKRAEIEAQTTSGRDLGAASVGPGEAVTASASVVPERPSHPAETTSGGSTLGRVPPSEAGHEVDDSSDTANAGAGTVISGDIPSSTAVGNPTPAPDDSEGAPLPPEPSDMPPPPSSAKAICGDDGGMMGVCQRAPGHTRKHQGPGGEWPQERGR